MRRAKKWLSRPATAEELAYWGIGLLTGWMLRGIGRIERRRQERTA